MKDIEIQPSEEMQLQPVQADLDMFEAKPQIKIHEPEELEISERSTKLDHPKSIVTVSMKSQGNITPEYDDEEVEEEDIVAPDDNSDSDWQAKPKRRTVTKTGASRSLRSPRKTSCTLIDPKARVQKPHIQGHNRRQSKSKKPRGPFSNARPNTPKQEKSFPCTFHTFGCERTFANKNEWKRHVASQHLQLGFYRCDLDTCNPDNGAYSNSGRRNNKRDKDEDSEHEVKYFNDFNRKDLFTQHCRRMHGPSRNRSRTPTREEELAFEAKMDNIRQRCWQIRRKAPIRSTCPICNRVFEAVASSYEDDDVDGKAEEKAWEERMEHVGRHYEKDNVKPENETIDDDLVEWGLANEVFYKAGASETPWLVSHEHSFHENLQENRQATDTSSGNGLASNESPSQRKQPSRAAVRNHEVLAPKPNSNTKVEEDEDSDEDADAEDE